MAERRPDLIIRSLRGNVGTRLSKLDNGEYDAIILAVAGLKRLGLESRIRDALPPEVSLPAVGQGAVGIECRLDDTRTRELLAALNHPETALRVTAERAMNTRLEGGCQVPIGSYAELIGGEIWLRALVGAPDGSQMIRGERRGSPQDAEKWVFRWQKNCSITAHGRFSLMYITEMPPHEYSGHPPVSRRGRISEPSAHTGQGGTELSTD